MKMIVVSVNAQECSPSLESIHVSNYLITRCNYSLHGTSCCCLPDTAKWQSTKQEQKHGSCLQESHCWLTGKWRIIWHVIHAIVDICRESFGDLGQKELVLPRERARHFQIWHFNENSQGGRRTNGVWVAGLLALRLLVWLWVSNAISWIGMQLCTFASSFVKWNNKIKVTDASSIHRTDAIIKGNNVRENVL